MTPAMLDGIIIANAAANSHPGSTIGTTGKSSPTVTARPAQGGNLVSPAARIWRHARRAKNAVSNPSTSAATIDSFSTASLVASDAGKARWPTSVSSFPRPAASNEAASAWANACAASTACVGDEARTSAELK